jgi:hypothetical protein
MASGAAAQASAARAAEEVQNSPVPGLDILADVLAASDNGSSIELAVRHDDDDTLTEHHHVGVRADGMEVAASKFIV